MIYCELLVRNYIYPLKKIIERLSVDLRQNQLLSVSLTSEGELLRVCTEMQPGNEKIIKVDSGWGVSFVMKLWLEPGEHENLPVWRWHVRHIQSGEEAYFRNMADMLKFVEQKSSLLPPS